MSAPAVPGRPRRPSLGRRLARRPGSRPALAWLALVALAALLAPALPLPAPDALRPERASQAPELAWRHQDPRSLDELAADHPLAVGTRRALVDEGALDGLLGTDPLGRDLAARVLWGARVSLAVGLAATLVSLLLGVAWGLLAGLSGPRTDALLMGLVDVLDAVPFLFVVILMVAALRGDPADAGVEGPARLVLLFCAIGAVSWLTMARVVRSQVRALRRRDFVLSARALGAGPLTIALRHVLPNLWGLILVALTLTVPRIILLEAFLSFLGLGVEPPGVSWGLLASEGLESLTAVSTAWWLVAVPGLALALTLGSLNLLGDALRDALDPRGQVRL